MVIKLTNEIVVKNIEVLDSKSKIEFVYRKNKDGEVHCNGFEVKVSGDVKEDIQKKADKLIEYGIERIKTPIPIEKEISLKDLEVS